MCWNSTVLTSTLTPQIKLLCSSPHSSTALHGCQHLDIALCISSHRIAPYSAGDAVEIKDWVTGQQTLIPLAGPANRQGRIAADNIAGRSSTFRGSQGSSVVGLFGMTLAGTGED
jgi:NADPH-dependent 2,4-dienoyl-CoA reductase/sulfur reductase-like enzyme